VRLYRQAELHRLLRQQSAASSTPGLEVLVHEVIAAISTSPLRMSMPS
jgi:hypothetical protein